MSDLSKEEKKAINQLKADTSFYDYELKNGNYIYELFKIEVYKKDVDIILNLIDKQQKELEQLKSENQTLKYDKMILDAKELMYKEELEKENVNLKYSLETKDKVIDKMATECSILTGRWGNLPNKEIIEYFIKKVENE